MGCTNHGRRWLYLSVPELEEISAPWRSSVVVPVRLRAGGSQRPLAVVGGRPCPSQSWRKSAPPGGRRWSYLSVSELEEVSAPWRSSVVVPVRLRAGGSQRPLAVVGGPTCPSRSWRKSAPPGGRRWSYLSVSELEEVSAPWRSSVVLPVRRGAGGSQRPLAVADGLTCPSRSWRRRKAAECFQMTRRTASIVSLRAAMRSVSPTPRSNVVRRTSLTRT